MAPDPDEIAYENLHRLVGKLKRACIDAYMHEVSMDPETTAPYGGGAWTIGDDCYYLSYGQVSRPGENGLGGGSYSVADIQYGNNYTPTDDSHSRSTFDRIRGQIDELIGPWFDLPDPAAIHEQGLALSAGYNLMAGSTQTDGSSGTPILVGSGELANHLEFLMLDSVVLSGKAMRTFRNGFLRSISNASGGCRAICYVLAYTLGREEVLWEGARQGVTNAVSKAIEAADKVAHGGSIEWQLLLQVAGWATAALSIVATKGAAVPVLSSIGLGIDIQRPNGARTTPRPERAPLKGNPTRTRRVGRSSGPGGGPAEEGARRSCRDHAGRGSRHAPKTALLDRRVGGARRRGCTPWLAAERAHRECRDSRAPSGLVATVEAPLAHPDRRRRTHPYGQL